MSRARQISDLAAAYEGGSFMLRNKLINGNFNVWQRGASFVSGGSAYTADCWAGSNNTGAVSRQSFTLGQTDVAGNPKYFLRFVSTANLDGIRQRIQGVENLSGKTVTVSFSAKVSTGTVTLTPLLSQVFGTGGSPSSPVTTTGSAKTLTTSWQRFTDKITIPSIAGKTLGSNNDDYIQLALSAGGSGTVDVANVQLEEGIVATPFENRPAYIELQMCRYYLQVHHAQQNTTNLSYQMRKAPTESGSGPYIYSAEL